MWLAAGGVAASLLLGATACTNPFKPVEVPFPDDIRVLSGAWELQVLGGEEALGFDSATLDLVAGPDPDTGSLPGDRYGFSGTIDLHLTDGGTTSMLIEGTVDGGGSHEYVPTDNGLFPQLTPPPPMTAYAEIRQAPFDDVVYTVFVTNGHDRLAASYEGHLYLVGEVGDFPVRLRRPAP